MSDFLNWLDGTATWLEVVIGLVVLHLAAFVFGVWLERRSLLKIAGKQRDASLVSAWGTDLCVTCRQDTHVPTSLHVDQRVGYVKGSGQICRKCAGDEE